jgi:hypothetical protein
MKSRFAWLAVVACIALSSAGPSIASGQAAQPLQLDPLSKFDIQSRRQIQSLIDSARLENLPWNSLRLKAIEGANKKYDGKKVLTVLRGYYKSLEQARGALGPLATPEEIETGASVLAAGVNVEDLSNFRVASASRSPMRPLTYLADLIDKHNVPRNDAIDAFTKLWKDGAADSDFDGLWRLVDQDILGGLSPRAALQSRMKSLPPRSKPPAGQEMENPRS